jgi:hypothetical protein
MNQRIRQLWIKAAESTAAYPSGQNNSWETQVNFLDKFAELIVQECVEISNQHPSKIFKKEWDADAVAWDITQRIKTHFGVEE